MAQYNDYFTIYCNVLAIGLKSRPDNKYSTKMDILSIYGLKRLKMDTFPYSLSSQGPAR